MYSDCANKLKSPSYFAGLPKLDEFSMEQIMEELETQVYTTVLYCVRLISTGHIVF